VGPATPTFKQTLSNGFGLLTPKTPNFGDLVTQSPAIVNNGEDNDSGASITSQARKTRLDAIREDHDLAGTQITNLDVRSQAQVETQHDDLQEQIRDAALAASLAQELDAPCKRRSTRLAKKEAEKGKHIGSNLSQSLTSIS
jgi:hypothetical protein